MPKNAALAFDDVSVNFGGLKALNSVSARFERGRIHVLVGQNGAGKSTLVRFCGGLQTPQTGTLEIDGKPVTPGDAFGARSAGLEIVHQRFSLPPTFSVADAREFVAHRKRQGAFYSANRLAREWRKVLAENDIDVPMNVSIQDLPVETVQALEIARALADDARILILDEPTALLSPKGIAELFGKLRLLKARGVTPILILHKLSEVMEIADTVCVLRGGELVQPPVDADALTPSQISDQMIGGNSTSEQEIATPAQMPRHGEIILKLENISSAATETEPGLADIAMEVGRGEIVGIAGVEGNGQRSLASVLCGLSEVKTGEIVLDGERVTKFDAAQRRKVGLRVVPFDRMSEGVSLELPLWENIGAWRAEDFSGSFGIVSIRKMKDHGRNLLKRFNAVFDSVDQPAGSLSGGNLQRLILARETDTGVRLIVAAQPTRGLDFKATEFVYQSLRGLSREGCGILLISSDLEELFALSDRVYVMRSGRVSGLFQVPFSIEAVGDAMVGGDRK